MKIEKIALAAVLAVVAAYAQNAPTKTLRVLTSAEIDPGRLLPPPPADGSESQRKELVEAERLVEVRTKERFAKAVWDNEHEDATAFAATIGRVSI